MNKSIFIFLLFSLQAAGQPYKLESSFLSLQKDSQFRHAIISLFVVDAGSGEVLFDRNSELGLAPASCQKIITSICAFDLLGKDYRFKTYIGVKGNDVYIIGGGDPTLGSNRWNSTRDEAVLGKLSAVLEREKLFPLRGKIYVNDLNWGYQPVPDGWVWQDLGNYFGAGAWSLNWKENKYQVYLRSSGTIGKPVSVVATRPAYFRHQILSLVTSAKKGSGDNSWLYAAPFSEKIFATGTIPVGEDSFEISGAMPFPAGSFMRDLASHLKCNPGDYQYYTHFLNNDLKFPPEPVLLDSIVSPSLDSINYWFLKKSINLFGEALVKAMAREKQGEVSTASGIEALKNYWKQRSPDITAMNIIDGSGLSPANRVTTKLLVDFLQYAGKQSWFSLFYEALPEINGIKMKDGYIGGVRSYTGYIRQKTGKTIVFAFIVNNFTGSPAAAKEKIWKLLDQLK